MTWRCFCAWFFACAERSPASVYRLLETSGILSSHIAPYGAFRTRHRYCSATFFWTGPTDWSGHHRFNRAAHRSLVRTVLHIGCFLRFSETVGIISEPAASRARAMPSPIMLVDPVTSDTLPTSDWRTSRFPDSDGDVHDCRLLFGKSIPLSNNLPEATHATPMPVG